eukprot:Lithocolla_globosa_v1_NODE_1125_length_2811_cov_40.797210.p2 type:complete len:118 gc:universal NODE_1125_length_2811_cov_40.797210:1717-1364(-)
MQPLDSNLFSDLEYGIKQHVANTTDLPINDPNKFLLGTHAQVSSSLRRTWEVFPTSERIVQDIDRWPKALEAIIEHDGAKVPEIDNRRGRRETVKHFPAHSCCKDALRAHEAKWASY